MIKTEFESLPSKEQWRWIIDNKDKVSHIDLDNDETYISFIDDDENESRFKADIGNRPGVNYLLEAIGITVYDV